MKTYFLILTLFVPWSYVAGQHSIDSLRSRLHQASPSEQGAIFEALAHAFIPVNKDSATALAEKASALFKTTKNDTALFNLNLSFGKTLVENGEKDLGLPYVWRAKAMQAEAVQSEKYRYKLSADIGALHYHYLGDYDSALYYDQQNLAMARNAVEKGRTLTALGLDYNALGMTVKALDAYLKAMHLLENKRDDTGLGGLYNNIGILYEDDGSNDKAEAYYKKAYESFKRSGNRHRQFAALNNLGILYSHEGKHEVSLQALHEAAKVMPGLGVKRNEGILDLNIGNTLVHMGKAGEALSHFATAMKVFAGIGDHYGTAICHRQMGEAFFKTGQYKRCEQEERLAMAQAKSNGYIYIVQDAHEDLSDLYAATRQYEKAHFHLKQYHTLKDSLSSRDRAGKLGLLEKEYALAKQEEEKKLLIAQQQSSVAQARIDRVTKLSLGSGLAFVLAAAAITLAAYRRTRARNLLLATQKEKILQQSQALEEAAGVRSRFFANVSHELRTPVTLITGMLEVLHEKLDKDMHPTLDIALNNSRKLQTLVDEVLDVTRLEHTSSTLVLTEKEIDPLLRRILAAFDSLFLRKSIALAYDVSGLAGISVAVDEDKFEKIINNLVYNAVKFNHEGGRISVSASLNDSGDTVTIRVADTGAGIPPEDVPRIFDRFYQSAGSQQHHAGGVGIGLSLVKEFTAMHGGTVSVQSNVGEGTTFEVTLPMLTLNKTTEAPAPVYHDPVVNFSDFDKIPALLVVEDNVEMQVYIREIFGDQVHMAFANNGRQAVQWLEDNPTDLIISDVMMPEMDGYALLRDLKISETLKGIPVVMLTARAAEEDRLHGLSLGVDDYLTKPFSGKELKIRVHNLLTNLQIRRQWQAQPPEPEELEKEPTENKLFIEKVEQFVRANIKNVSLGIPNLADHLAMSERQLYRKCGLLTGMAPAQLIKEVRLQLAYKMLTDKEVSKIAELAARIGFDDPAYFSRQFLERFGKRPSEILGRS